MKLFVQNQTEEYICDVSAEPDVLNCSKLLVVSYCRDPDITGPKYELMCVITPKSEEDERKYLSFVDYVIARKKTAVIKADCAELLFAHCTVGTAPKRTLSIFKKIACASLPMAVKRIPSPAANRSSAPQQSVGGFLNDLLGKVDSKAKVRSYNATGARGNIDTVAALETETRRLLREFLDSSNENELAMSPMDKHSRYIVHEIVDEFDGLVSASIGDDEYRHVVVYRNGFEPPEVQLHLGADLIKNNIKRKVPLAKSVKKDSRLAIMGSVTISKIETEKRDRRSIEEIQKDMKRRKLDNGDDSDAVI